jgi:hypothetical protein
MPPATLPRSSPAPPRGVANLEHYIAMQGSAEVGCAARPPPTGGAYPGQGPNSSSRPWPPLQPYPAPTFAQNKTRAAAWPHQKIRIDYDTVTRLYEDPTNLDAIEVGRRLTARGPSEPASPLAPLGV